MSSAATGSRRPASTRRSGTRSATRSACPSRAARRPVPARGARRRSPSAATATTCERATRPRSASASARSRSRSGAIPTPMSPASRLARELVGRRRAARGRRERRLVACHRARAPCRGCAELDIAFVEQPVDGGRPRGHARGARAGLPVVADESVYSAADVGTRRPRRSGRRREHLRRQELGPASGPWRRRASRREPRGRCRDRRRTARWASAPRRNSTSRVPCERARRDPLRHHRPPLLRRRPDARGAARDRRAASPGCRTGPGLGVRPSEEIRRSFAS